MPSSIEEARRKKQAAESPVKGGTKGRAQRRRDQRAGVALLHDPHTTFRLKYELSVPGGPLRDSNPAGFSGALTAETEADITRGIIVKLIEAFGYTAYGRAVTGMFAEIVNPLSGQLRSEILMQIAQGSGLHVYAKEVTSCIDCGAEQEVIDILDPNAEDGAQMEQQDVTQHEGECPGGFGPVVAEWRTGPGIFIAHPYKYQPLMTPQSAGEQPGNTIEVGESGVDAEGFVVDGE